MPHRFQLENGREVPRQRVNGHHVFWEKGWYTPEERKTFRNIGGLVIPMFIPIHDDLHASVEPPLKPSHKLQQKIADFTRDVYTTEYETFQKITVHIGNIASTSWSPQEAHEAFLIHDNLVRQDDFISKGRVTLNVDGI